MSAALASARRVVAAIVVALLGVAFFFALIGSFGLPAAIAALVVFLMVAFPIFGRPQAGRAPP
jgi:hypothetical protein